MATRKKKNNPTRAKSRERASKKKAASPKRRRNKLGQFVAKKKAVSPKRRRNKLGRFVVTPPPKPRRNKRGQFLPKVRPPPKQRAPRKRKKIVIEIEQPKTTFRKERSKNKKKIPKPAHPKRRGKIEMRGAMGQERSIPVQQFWEKVNEGLLHAEIMHVYASLLNYAYPSPPSLYSRFTFITSHIDTTSLRGYPKPLALKKGTMGAWFFTTDLSYHLTGAEFRLEKALNEIDDTISDIKNENPNAEFFLEFVTVRAYVVN